MKRSILILFLSVFIAFAGYSQSDPISWKASYKALSELEGEIVVTAVIEPNWHTYSQQPNNAVPLPTLFSYKESKSYKLIGKTEEANAHEEFDEALGEKLLVFTGSAEFKQKVKLSSKQPQTIFLKVEYICCNNKMCMPPKTVDLKVQVP